MANWLFVTSNRPVIDRIQAHQHDISMSEVFSVLARMKNNTSRVKIQHIVWRVTNWNFLWKLFSGANLSWFASYNHSHIAVDSTHPSLSNQLCCASRPTLKTIVVCPRSLFNNGGSCLYSLASDEEYQLNLDGFSRNLEHVVRLPSQTSLSKAGPTFWSANARRRSVWFF